MGEWNKQMMKTLKRSFGTWRLEVRKRGKVRKILMTGAQGQVGSSLLPYLNALYGRGNIYCTDVRTDRQLDTSHFEVVDILDKKRLEEIVKSFHPDTIIHLSSIVSAYGEQHPDEAIRINNGGFINVLELAKKYKLGLFSASTIATFGPTSPLVNTPNLCLQRPETIYGVTKVYMEMLGEYYHRKFGVNFRCLRYPITLSAAMPGPVTARCTVEAYYDALLKGKYVCYIKGDRPMPVIYINDIIQGTIGLIEADDDKLTTRTYNMSGFSCTMDEIRDSIKKHIPNFEMTTELDFRQKIIETWPMSIDSATARDDWSFIPYYDLQRTTDEMITLIRRELKSTGQLN
eukprot:TRINITY_DN13797_c0_g1_i1.p1 TRINITY_DN13797_c0_g1~~TRINITY_DN13797_c0_g1_i1.p1  ORF type:complete len:345 (+),score=73.25 TRINITY_DN13797_c0_g1_i1:126-1160(+)